MDIVVGICMNDFGREYKFLVDKEIWEPYVEDFIKQYVQNGRPYRISTSGKIIFEGIEYGKIGRFMSSLPLHKQLKESVKELNSEEFFKKFNDSDLFSALENTYENEILKAIEIEKEEEIQYYKKMYHFKTPTFVMNGKEMVFLIYDEASSGIDLYAVPVELAKELNLEDYDSEEISRSEPFLDELEKRGAINLTKHSISCYNSD